MNKQEEILKEYMKWCNENINICNKISKDSFDSLTARAYDELKQLTNEETDYASFICGIAVGMKIMVARK